MANVRLEPAFSVEKAHETQIRLSRHIVFEDILPKKVSLIGGVDVAYVKGISIAAVAVLDFDSLRLKESKTTTCQTRFPYIPTLLSFRETPPSVKCVRRLDVQPDLFLIDGHGYAHPYRCGFASHFGLVIGKPTIGVAKGILVGKAERRNAESDTAFILDKGEIIGAEIYVKDGLKPIYVSVGHMISLRTAIRIVKKCLVQGHGRIPEPIYHAHQMATAGKRKINISIHPQRGNE